MPVDKSGRVFLVGSVPLLHPEVQTVEEMLDGWRNQQLCRNLDPDTIDDRVGLVRRFIAHTNEYPWSWTPAIVEEFFADLRGIKGRAQSTVRGYQNGLRLFCSYIADPDYGWDRVCEQRFGTHPRRCSSPGTPPPTSRTTSKTPRNGRSPNRNCRTSSTTPTTRSP